MFDTEVTLEQYLDKSFYKTASLIAASCRSSAVFSQMDEDHKEAMYAYGKHLGLAFQVGQCCVWQQAVSMWVAGRVGVGGRMSMARTWAWSCSWGVC